MRIWPVVCLLMSLVVCVTVSLSMAGDTSQWWVYSRPVTVSLSMAGDSPQWWVHNRLADSEDSGVSCDCHHVGVVHVAHQSSRSQAQHSWAVRSVHLSHVDCLLTGRLSVFYCDDVEGHLVTHDDAVDDDDDDDAVEAPSRRSQLLWDGLRQQVVTNEIFLCMRASSLTLCHSSVRVCFCYTHI